MPHCMHILGAKTAHTGTVTPSGSGAGTGPEACTAAEAAVRGQLQGSLWAVPAVPGELILALLDATLSPCGHTAGVD